MMNRKPLNKSYTDSLPLRENDQPDRTESAKANEVKHNKTMAA